VFLFQSFQRSLGDFLRETGLHGLKFVGDSSLSIWERYHMKYHTTFSLCHGVLNFFRAFFLAAFVVAFVLTCQLISNIYAKWNSTPVIIGISPHATSILKVPFPAVTICNMNQVQRSKVINYRKDNNDSTCSGSREKELLKVLCSPDSADFDDADTSTSGSNTLANNTLIISEFVMNHSQTCDQMLLYCRFSAIEYDCLDLFRELITDEGLCCVFNFLPPEFLYKPQYEKYSKAFILCIYITFDFSANSGRNLTTKHGFVPVKWDPESGYPPTLPNKFYPHVAVGSGITMGFSVVLNAQLNEYFCSSTNGPGFKVCFLKLLNCTLILSCCQVLFHNPIATPNLKDEGLVVGLGYEMNFRLEVSSSEAMPTIRSIPRDDRQCIFQNEKQLLYHRHYTHQNCENECIAQYLYATCACIPEKYPLIYRNASVCSIKDTICVRQALRPENTLESAKCRKKCLPSCFDLSYLADAFYFPLAKRDYHIANPLVAEMNKSFLLENIAVMNLYYREYAYYGSMKNVYVGLTEFLSNIGGVMGLFMGFSVISLAEMLYFLVLKPISELIAWKRNDKPDDIKPNASHQQNPNSLQYIWHTRELYPKGLGRSPVTTEAFNQRKTKAHRYG
ncbi:hypothetical protein KR222_010582, partial [Zaprionus bogoriensis]